MGALDALKSAVSSKGLRRVGLTAVPAALLAVSADVRAETWDCDIDIDSMVPSAGTNYNSESVYAFSGIPGSISTRAVMGTDSLGQVQETSDGVTFSDTRSTLEAIESDFSGNHYKMSGYSPTFDQAFIYVISGSDSYVVSDVSLGSSSWTLSATAINSGSNGSIGDVTGDVYLSDWVSSDSGIYKEDGTEVLNDPSDNEWDPQFDEENDRIGIGDDDDLILVTDVSGAQTPQSLSTNAYPVQYLSADNSPNELDTWIYISTDDYQLYYCEDLDSSPSSTPVDADSDGYDSDVDCDDSNPSIHPGADEYCDGIDNDCDDVVDEDDAVDASTWYPDVDEDGYGSQYDTVVTCYQPTGYLGSDGDCDDSDATTYPGATETCDGVDNDCDLVVDEDAVDMGTWYQDADGDGVGNSEVSTQSCDQPEGYVSVSGDCDDNDGDKKDDEDCEECVESETVDCLGEDAAIESTGGTSGTYEYDAASRRIIVSSGASGHGSYTISTSGAPIEVYWEDAGDTAIVYAETDITAGVSAGMLMPNYDPEGVARCVDGSQTNTFDSILPEIQMQIEAVAGVTEVRGDIDFDLYTLEQGQSATFTDIYDCGMDTGDTGIETGDPDTDGPETGDTDTQVPGETGYLDTGNGGGGCANCSAAYHPDLAALSVLALAGGFALLRRRRDGSEVVEKVEL